MSGARGRWLLLAPLALALLLHARTIGYGFLLDDDMLVVDRAAEFDDLGNLPRFFREGFWPTAVLDRYRMADTVYYRPAVTALNALNRHVAGGGAAAYHAVNVALHLSNVLLLGLLLLGLGAGAPAAALASALFAVHPLAAASVDWVSGRTDLQCATFALGSLCLLVGWLERGGLARLAGVAVLGLGAVLSKETGLLLPLVGGALVLTAPRAGGRRWWPAALALGVPIAGYLLLRHAAFGIWLPPTELRAEALSAGLATLGYDVLKIALPIRLVLIPNPWELSATGPRSAVGVLALLLLALALARSRDRRVRTGLAAAFLFLLPVLQLVSIITYPGASYCFYLPLAGLAIAAAAPLDRLARATGRNAALGRGAALVAVLALALLCFGYGSRFADAETLCRGDLASDPANTKALLALSELDYRRGRYDEADQLLRRARAENPDDVQAVYDLAMVKERLGRDDQAVDLYREAIRRAPRYADAYTNLGTILFRTDRLDEALALFQNARALHPADLGVRSNVIACLNALGRYPEALAEFERASTLPATAALHANHGNTLLELGRAEEAEREFRAALAADPGYALGYKNLGVVYARMLARPRDACASFRRYLEIAPGDPQRPQIERYLGEHAAECASTDELPRPR